MPRITDLQAQKKNKQRLSVYVEGEFFCGVSKEAVARLGLKPGQEKTEAELSALRGTEADIEVREQALRWLDRRAYARGEMARRLRTKAFPPEAIERVLDRLQETGLLNDEAFAQAWVREHSRGGALGSRRVRQELRQKGVADEVIGAVWSELGTADEGETCAELAQKKWRSLKQLPPETARRRLLGFLTRRGFTLEDALRAAKQVMPGDDEPELD